MPFAASKEYYPTSLSTWDDVATRVKYVTALPMDAFEAVRLTRLTETPLILPSAFFTCCKNLRSSFAEGDSVERHRFLEKLPVDDAWCLINGRETLTQGILSRLAKIHTTYTSLPSGYRTSHKACQKRLIASVQELRTNEQKVLLKNAWYHAAFEPLGNWCRINPGDPTQRMLKCEPCLAALKECDEGTRMKVWNELPRYFDVEIEGLKISSE